MRHYLFLCLLLASFPLWAQNDERPESNLDLRGGKSLFQILAPGAKTSTELHQSAGGDYFLQGADRDGVHKNKIGRPRAEQLDQRFAALHLRLQYELPADPESCREQWKLVLRGEGISACAKSEQKNQEIQLFFDELRKDLHP